MNNVRKVQMTQMEVLRVFMDICERHRLRWYMIGGSLIGVLRHKGFIPWDDDIDIGRNGSSTSRNSLTRRPR